MELLDETNIICHDIDFLFISYIMGKKGEQYGKDFSI